MLDLREGDSKEENGKDGPTLDSAITNIIVRARTQAQIAGQQSAGEIPAEILRIIDELLN